VEVNPFNKQVAIANGIPRTLIIDLSDNFGGTNARVLALMKSLPKDSIGLATLEGSHIASELKTAGYQVHCVSKNKFDPRIPLRIAHILRANAYQLVDTQNPQSKLWGSLAAFLSGVPLISTLNSWYMNEHPRYSLRWFGYSCIELMTNFVLSRYIVVSQEIRTAMLRFGIPASKIDLIYNAIEIDSFKVTDNRDQWLKKYHLPFDAILCVAAGRLSWAKGQDNLIRALSMVVDDKPEVYCLIAGDGELRLTLEAQIKSAGLDKRVILLGHLSRPEVLSLINACDIFVMPSRTEGTPIALLEAATLKKPILATRVGGIPELVKGDDESLLVNPDDPVKIADGIRYLIRETGFTKRIVENAYQRVISDFTLNVQTRSTIQSYNKALQGS